MLEFLWRQFQLHRAVSIIMLAQKELINKHRVNMRFRSKWEELTHAEIMQNVQTRVHKMTSLRAINNSSIVRPNTINARDIRRSSVRKGPQLSTRFLQRKPLSNS